MDPKAQAAAAAAAEARVKEATELQIKKTSIKYDEWRKKNEWVRECPIIDKFVGYSQEMESELFPELDRSNFCLELADAITLFEHYHLTKEQEASLLEGDPVGIISVVTRDHRDHLFIEKLSDIEDQICQIKDKME